MDATCLSLNLATEKDLRESLTKVDTRRYAVFYPTPFASDSKSTTVDITVSVSDDVQSSWDFTATATSISERPSTLSTSSSTTATTASACTTSAAQEIIARYRAAQADSMDRASSYRVANHRNSDKISFADTVSIAATRAGSVLDMEARPSRHEVKARFRQSQTFEIDRAGREAAAIMKRCGLTEHDQLVCQRPGCRDTLRDVTALKFHLHIHNISDGIYECPHCDGRYECSRELEMHSCRRRLLKSPPASPIKDGFNRVLVKMFGVCN